MSSKRDREGREANAVTLINAHWQSCVQCVVHMQLVYQCADQGFFQDLGRGGGGQNSNMYIGGGA